MPSILPLNPRSVFVALPADWIHCVCGANPLGFVAVGVNLKGDRHGGREQVWRCKSASAGLLNLSVGGQHADEIALGTDSAPLSALVDNLSERGVSSLHGHSRRGAPKRQRTLSTTPVRAIMHHLISIYI